MIRSTFAPALLAIALALPGLAHAQTITQTNARKLAQFGGGMHAMAKACPRHEVGDLVKLKQQQKAQSIASGIDAAEFETLFQTGYDDTRAKLARATPAERAKGCAQFDRLGQVRR